MANCHDLIIIKQVSMLISANEWHEHGAAEAAGRRQHDKLRLEADNSA